MTSANIHEMVLIDYDTKYAVIYFFINHADIGSEFPDFHRHLICVEIHSRFGFHR